MCDWAALSPNVVMSLGYRGVSGPLVQNLRRRQATHGTEVTEPAWETMWDTPLIFAFPLFLLLHACFLLFLSPLSS